MDELLFPIYIQGDRVFLLDKPSLEMDRDERTTLDGKYEKRRARVRMGPKLPAREVDVYVRKLGDDELYYVTAATASEGTG